MYNYEYEDDILLFLRLMKFLHMEQPRTVEQIIKDYPTADEEDIGMILDELLMTVFDEGAPDNEDDLMTVRFSDTQIDRLYSQGCKHNEMLPYQINAWQEKIKDVFLFYVAETSYSVFDVCYRFSDSGVKFDITLSPDCYEPAPTENGAAGFPGKHPARLSEQRSFSPSRRASDLLPAHPRPGHRRGKDAHSG